ncbi:MAG: iron-containing alcohol dehydrogenase [bacterium]|nr:iron-containing alcohol dehydrogenase [bacterium]
MFNFITPGRIIFGKQSIGQLGVEAAKFGRDAMLVTGVSALRKLKVLDRVEEDLKKSGIKVFLFDKVKGEPDLEIIEECRDLAKKNKVDMLIGLGGGSVIDTAKAVAGLYNEKGSCREYQKGRKIEKCGIPFIAVPTVAGSGSEVTYNAVILDREDKIKRSLRDFSLIAKLVIIDPLLSVSVPTQVKIRSGIDALIHAIEGYTSLKANQLTNSLALSAVNLIYTNIREVAYEENNIPVHGHMSLGTLKAGMVVANAGLGAIHGIAASLGAYFEIPHGLACAVLLPKVLEFNKNVCGLQYYHLLQALGEHAENLSINEVSDNFIVIIEKLMLDLKIHFHIERFEISEEDVLSIAKNCSTSINFNPKELKKEDIIDIINSVLCK